MEYFQYTANDGCRLAFQSSLPLPAVELSNTDPRSRRCILLIHGFSGSSKYFKHNFAALSESHWIIAVDLRGHGRSDRPKGGYHVARLAMDLRELVAYLHIRAPDVGIVPVGCSIGAAVLWTYVELFGCSDFMGFVFVDQAPLQDRSAFDNWDDTKAHRGCFDEASLLAAQRAWAHNSVEAHKGLVADCLGYRFAPKDGDDLTAKRMGSDEEFFTSISAQCNQEWLARLLADHTRYDHREAIEDITVPTLVLVGERTGCFPLLGMAETVERVNRSRKGLGWAEMRVFKSGHWLFYEEPDLFNREVTEFANRCMVAEQAQGAR